MRARNLLDSYRLPVLLMAEAKPEQIGSDDWFSWNKLQTAMLRRLVVRRFGVAASDLEAHPAVNQQLCPNRKRCLV
jgi:hypothetical protein